VLTLIVDGVGASLLAREHLLLVRYRHVMRGFGGGNALLVLIHLLVVGLLEIH
jgi:hypothetical protein